MSCGQSYPFPQVLTVDGGGPPRRSDQPPGLVPRWSFPPAQVRERGPGKSRTGVSLCQSLMGLLLFLLMFAALAFEAFQIYNLQTELKQMRQGQSGTEFNTPQRQTGVHEAKWLGKDNRPAAHVIGHIEKQVFPETLRWQPKVGQAFVSGGVAYLVEDGGLQVNASGLYHIYSRVELTWKNCSPMSSFIHSMFVRRRDHVLPLTLMEAHQAGFCPKQDLSWTSHSYLGSAMKLQKHDRVYVKVSHPRYVSHEHYANFFGLYKI